MNTTHGTERFPRTCSKVETRGPANWGRDGESSSISDHEPSGYSIRVARIRPSLRGDTPETAATVAAADYIRLIDTLPLSLSNE